MNWAWTVGTVRDIRIRIHVTFLLLIPWAAYYWGIAPRRGWPGALFGLAITGAVFLLVVWHELAHSLVARHYGVQVREIELSPIGGIAKMESMPEQPWQELVTALAGPLVSLATSLPLGWMVWRMIQDGTLHSRSQFLYLLTKPSWQGFVLNLFVCNVLLALFNLFPAFPMDGGRVLRSVLAWRMGRTRGTLWATYIGQVGAIALGTLGILSANVIIILIAMAIFGAARQEYHATEMEATLGDMLVSEALITAAPALSPDDPLASAMDLMRRGRSAPYAVVAGGQLAGLLAPMDITSALEFYNDQVRVGDIMRRKFPVLSPTDTLARAHQIMATAGLQALPVAQGGQFLGMVRAQQIRDIQALRAAQDRRQQSEKDLARHMRKG